ncbi:Predicted membrane protein [Mycobacteroides abscessus subsp. abscessus]|nr:Predicted membrane protein [Mycobacteroides abscessus subsp. abscessus]
MRIVKTVPSKRMPGTMGRVTPSQPDAMSANSNANSTTTDNARTREKDTPSATPRVSEPRSRTDAFLDAVLDPRRLAPLGLALAATTLYGWLSMLQWDSFFFPSWDLGIFAEAVKEYAHFNAPIVPIKGDNFNLLGDHFHPVLALLAPLWWLWPSPAVLLWAQAAMFGASAYPLTRVAMAKLGPRLGMLAGAGYAFSFGLQGSQNVQFHEYAFAVLFVAFGLAAFLEDRPKAALLWIGALVFVKEDLGLTVMMLGLAMAWMWRTPGSKAGSSSEKVRRLVAKLASEKKPRSALLLAAWGLVWFGLATWVILPALSPASAYVYTENFAPITQVLTPLVKWQTVLMFVMFMGLVGVKSPLALGLLPTFAWRFLGSVEHYWTWQWHYNSFLMAIAFAALLATLPHVNGTLLTQLGELRERPVAPNTARLWTKRLGVVASLASTAYLMTALPLTWVVTGGLDPNSEFANAAREAQAHVPEGVTVATDIRFMAPLIPTNDVQWMHGETKRAPECIAGVYGKNEQEQFPGGWAEWANEKWPANASAKPGHLNGASVITSARKPYDLVFANAYVQVACQGGASGA